MVNLFFFLKFKVQLRRTRPELVRQLDESLIRAITDAGGKLTGERTVISSVFNEDTTGFWLDMYILIENLKKSIDASPEFFGYSLVITGDMPDTPELLCRFLSSPGGVFLDAKSASNFYYYADFEKPSEWHKEKRRHKYGSGGFFKINELKVFKAHSKNDLDLQKDAVKILEQNEGKNVLILGPAFALTHGGLYRYCAKMNGNFPALTLCFGSIGLGALVDAWSPAIRSLSSEQATEEIDSLWELLFRERIRDEVSDFIFRSVARFLSLLLDYYFKAARKKKRIPVLVLENVHLAGKIVADLLIDALANISDENWQELLVLGIGEDDITPEKLRQWEPVFTKVGRIEKNQKQAHLPKLPTELWEIVYAISLFGNYFSPELFQRLFEEDEKNPAMITRAFSILHTLGVIDNPREPRPMNRHYEDHARRMLGAKITRVKTMVRGRLLSWVAKRNINPCFRLLTIMSALDGMKQIDDLLLLKSIFSDIINETTSSLETGLKSGQFEEIVTVKAAAIRYVYTTSVSLHTGKEQDIESTFFEPPVDCEPFPVLKAQIIVNLCGYYLGRRDIVTALDMAKEAILLAQRNNNFCLPQAYRLFSLVCLSKHQTNETIEYLGFALSNAEKAGNFNEMGITSYYAAAAQFLYGDIYTAQRFARNSVEQSLAAGRPEWADRARFLEGRFQFELGHYREAHDIFDALRKQPFGIIKTEKEKMLAAWIYRSKIYFQDPRIILKPETANHDANLFEIEAAYLSGNYQRVVDLSVSLENPFSIDNYLYTEQPDWRSGFAQCEHLYFSHGEIQDRMVCMFYSLAISRLSAQKGEEAMQNIERILRDERLCEMDPWDAFYFYAKYRVLEQTSASLVDMSTAVSMAFKRLQRRAGRIEDIEIRRQYMNGSHWNRELSLAAKEFKLI